MELEQLTLFPPDSPASPSATPGNGGGLTTTAISGRKLYAYCPNYGPLGLLARMLLGSSVWQSQMGRLTWSVAPIIARRKRTISKVYLHKRKLCSSTVSVKTLKTSDMKSKYMCFRLRLSTRKTSESGSSFWATPSAADSVGSHGGGQGKSLRTDIAEWKAGMWPTPKANNSTGPSTHGEGGQDLQTAVLWPTPRANDAEKRGSVSSDDVRHGLPGAVRKMWPTPKASDAIMGTTARTSGRPIEKSTHLQTQVHLHSLAGQLNPEWVEILMCFPPGWTETE